jgi:hypothetical protein
VCKWLEHLTSNVKVTTVLGLISASFDTVESEGTVLNTVKKIFFIMLLFIKWQGNFLLQVRFLRTEVTVLDENVLHGAAKLSEKCSNFGFFAYIWNYYEVFFKKLKELEKYNEKCGNESSLCALHYL